MRRSLSVPVPSSKRRSASPTAAIHLPTGNRLIGPAAQGVYVEQYRRLVASLHELQVDRGLKALMVTSALPREGKTLTVVNAALTLSNSYGRRVLLIDADLRRPTIHEVLGVENVVGLNEALVGDQSDLPVVQVSAQLDVLTAGRSTNDPFKALISERMRALLENACSHYDWVLLDAPPVGLMPDAALLAGMTGATLLVIAACSTPYKLVDRVVQEIGRERIVGTVLNRIDDGNIPATGYYSDYYAVATK
jgi:capsular exopolysaccharide synthesis family protein